MGTLLLRRSLTTLHATLPSGCPVIVQEFRLNNDKTRSLLAVFQWFGMLRGTWGEQRTGRERTALMAQVGFREMEIPPIDGDQSMVIGWKREWAAASEANDLKNVCRQTEWITALNEELSWRIDAIEGYWNLSTVSCHVLPHDGGISWES